MLHNILIYFDNYTMIKLRYWVGFYILLDTKLGISELFAVN